MDASELVAVKDTTVRGNRRVSLSFLLRLDRLNSKMVTLAEHMRVLMESLSRHMVDPAE